ncbi:MAG: cation transporter, partial [Clostridia bacterium]|nr:cation transporter [Clostridia bacterium]
MRKVFQMQDLDCANCAAKMERAIQSLEGVSAVSISFLTQKMVLEAEEAQMDAILKQAKKICRKIEPD